MYEFWFGYVKPKYGEKSKLCYMGKDGFLAYKKTGDIYKDIVEDVDARFDLSNYELDRPLTKRKNKKVEKLIRWENYGKMYFTEEINKIALRSNDEKRMQYIDLRETCIWHIQRSSKWRRRD